MKLKTGKWDKKGFFRKALIFSLIAGPIWFISMLSVMTDTITIKYDGFALDSNGLLYVGEAKGIAVYDDGEFVKTVYRMDALVWAFTIHDDKLYISTAKTIMVMDLSGNIIEIIDDSEAKAGDRLYGQRNVFVTDDASYIATNRFGYYKIAKHNNGESETIFQMPQLDIILGTALYVIPIICLIIFFTGYINWLNERSQNRVIKELSDE